MSIQPMLPFEDVPITCSTQAKYHAIAPCLAGQVEPKQQAKLLNLSYSTVSRWLKQFREEGMQGLFPVSGYNREPYTPEKIIVSVIYFKCCVPKAADRELARVIGNMTGHQLHHITVKSLLERYFFWRYEEFQKLIVYPILPDAQSKRREIVKLDKDGWTEKSITVLVKCHRSTVRKWLRRNKEEEKLKVPIHQQLLDWSHSPLQPKRKVYFGTIHTILNLQKKYPTAGWFRIQGYLLKDFGIQLGQTTLKKVMKLNRKLHLIPRIEKLTVEVELKEPPPRSNEPFTYAFIDIRYLDAKPNGVQLYSCLLLEGFSRTILAGSLTSKQDVGIILRIYYLALLQWGLWKTIVSDNGSQFRSHAFANANANLGINQHFCEKGRPWQNLIESQFGIQARLGEYLWQQCRNVNEAIEVHRELIRDHNRLPHFAHRKRQDGKGSPLEVLGNSRGAEIDKTQLHQAFSRQVWQRKINEKGFIRVGRWKIYVEEGLPKTPIELIYWDGKLRAEYRQEKLAEYDCRWNDKEQRPQTIEKPKHFKTKYSSRQPELFEVGWLREPIEEMRAERKSSNRVFSTLVINPPITETGSFSVHFNDMPQGWVFATDIAAVAAAVLREGPEKHGGANYWLSTEVLTGPEVADILTAATGKVIKCNALGPNSLKEYINQISSIPVRAYMESAYITMQLAAAGEMSAQTVVHDDVLTVLGRPGITMAEWARQYLLTSHES